MKLLELRHLAAADEGIAVFNRNKGVQELGAELLMLAFPRVLINTKARRSSGAVCNVTMCAKQKKFGKPTLWYFFNLGVV